ncbi:MAG: hypothetical protein HXX10_07710 [Rhodoplanes sp.]|uniref:hypothetical protein n=1 Tax=Rhodoplanes sp. TaxID=1968906 RepID=UPI00181D096C|nr:hypothetical protein [Rhodoplanes sp.]NVO13907.1 hypothetical protein [Rhodoplanes sp.]
MTATLTSAAASLDRGPWSFRNRLLNGAGWHNQRVVSGTVTLAAGVYGHDRWKAGAGGCTYTFATSGADTVFTITAGTLLQVIENINIEGGTYTASWVGTATARIYQGAASGSYAASGFTVTGLAAKTATAIEFSTGTMSLAQVEPGSFVTPFERRFVPFELSLCQRYFEIDGGYNPDKAMYEAYGISGNNYNAFVRYLAPKRAVPTLTITNVAAGGFNTAIDYQESGIEGFRVRHTATSTGTIYYIDSWKAEAEL